MKGKGQVEGIVVFAKFSINIDQSEACLSYVTPSHWSIFSKKLAPQLAPNPSSKISDSGCRSEKG